MKEGSSFAISASQSKGQLIYDPQHDQPTTSRKPQHPTATSPIMSQEPTAAETSLASSSSPHTPEEMQAANVEIHTWYASGAVLPAAPVDALTTWTNQTLATGNFVFDYLAQPAARQTMRLEDKQTCLDTFRRVLEKHAESGIDAAGLQAEAASIRSKAQQIGVEEYEKVRKWTKHATMLQKKEDLVGSVAGKVIEMEAEEGLQ